MHRDLNQVLNNPENKSLRALCSPKEQRTPYSYLRGLRFLSITHYTQDPTRCMVELIHATWWKTSLFCRKIKSCAHIWILTADCSIKNPNPGEFNSVYSAPASKQLEENILGHIQMYDHKLQSESQMWSGQPIFPYLDPSHILQSPFTQPLLKPPALFPPSPLLELTTLLQISLKNQKNRSISPRFYHPIKLPAQALTSCHPPAPRQSARDAHRALLENANAKGLLFGDCSFTDLRCHPGVSVFFKHSLWFWCETGAGNHNDRWTDHALIGSQIPHCVLIPPLSHLFNGFTPEIVPTAFWITNLPLSTGTILSVYKDVIITHIKTKFSLDHIVSFPFPLTTMLPEKLLLNLLSIFPFSQTHFNQMPAAPKYSKQSAYQGHQPSLCGQIHWSILTSLALPTMLGTGDHSLLDTCTLSALSYANNPTFLTSITNSTLNYKLIHPTASSVHQSDVIQQLKFDLSKIELNFPPETCFPLVFQTSTNGNSILLLLGPKILWLPLTLFFVISHVPHVSNSFSLYLKIKPTSITSHLHLKAPSFAWIIWIAS